MHVHRTCYVKKMSIQSEKKLKPRRIRPLSWYCIKKTFSHSSRELMSGVVTGPSFCTKKIKDRTVILFNFELQNKRV
jgi:hypothetical protein